MNGRGVLNSMGLKIGVGFIALGVSALLIVRPVFGQSHNITDLGTLGGDSSEAFGINNSGQVIGWSSTASGAVRAFLYSGGVMTDLGTLTGGTYSFATGINNLGQVVGYGGINAYGPMFREFTQAFIWQDGGMQLLGALYCPCTFNKRYGTSAAFAINAAGQVAGDSETVRGEWVRHAFLSENATMEDIGGGAGDWSISRAYAVNDAGQVVGDFAQGAGLLGTQSGLDRRAFVWQSGVRQDLGTLPDHSSSTAFGINPVGQVVGWSGSPDGMVSRAFLWVNGVMLDLGTLPGDTVSQALGINAISQVVGWSGTPDGSLSRAFLWQSGAMLHLNSLLPQGSGWELTSATGINDNGQIIGIGLHNGQTRAFLLEPILDAGNNPSSDPDPVHIDIKPGDFPTSIKLRSRGKIPVAILSSSTFDALQGVDRASLTFGRTGDELSLAFCNSGGKDVNGDGLPDLVCHFNTVLSGFQSGDSEGVLKGHTNRGTAIIGRDSVTIVPN